MLGLKRQGFILKGQGNFGLAMLSCREVVLFLEVQNRLVLWEGMYFVQRGHPFLGGEVPLYDN